MEGDLQDIADLVGKRKWLMFIYREHRFLIARRERGMR